MSFFNSYKMKVSIVFGVAQMALGIVLSFFNTREFKDPRSFYFGVVPELVFFGSIFGYLVFMIMRKWSIDWVEAGESPPSLLNTLIAMFMSPGVYTEAGRLFPGQEYLQLVLVLRLRAVRVSCIATVEHRYSREEPSTSVRSERHVERLYT